MALIDFLSVILQTNYHSHSYCVKTGGVIQEEINRKILRIRGVTDSFYNI